jgi:hypothetical protein
MHGNNDRARAVEASLVAAAQDLSKTRHSRDQVAPLTMVAQKVGPLFGAVAMKKILPAMLMFTLVVLFAVVQYAAAAPSPP